MYCDSLRPVYDTWFTPIHLERIEDSTALLGVPNKFFCDCLSQHHGALLISVHYPSAKEPAARACTPVTGNVDGVLRSRQRFRPSELVDEQLVSRFGRVHVDASVTHLPMRVAILYLGTSIPTQRSCLKREDSGLHERTLLGKVTGQP